MNPEPLVHRLAIRTHAPGHSTVHCAQYEKETDVSSCYSCGHCIGLSARDSFLVCGWKARDAVNTKAEGHPMKQTEDIAARPSTSVVAPLGRFEKPVVTANLDDTIFDVACQMRNAHVGCVVVVRNDRPVGMLTDRDIVLRVVAAGLDARTALVSSIVTYDAQTVARTDGFETAVRVMREHGVRRLPIVDEQGRVTGIVTADDLVALLSRELSSLGEAITSNVDGSESR